MSDEQMIKMAGSILLSAVFLTFSYIFINESSAVSIALIFVAVVLALAAISGVAHGRGR